MKTLSFGFVFGISLCSLFICSYVDAATLYVAPDGRPDWSGTLPQPNAERSDGPLPSMIAARDTIRARRTQGQWTDEAITVYLRGGTYFLTETPVFDPRDSGITAKPVSYAAYQDEKPILSGGRRITGWRNAEINGKPCWAVELPEVKEGKWYFRQLFVNDQRRHRPRVPEEGFYFLTGIIAETAEQEKMSEHDRVSFRPGDMKNWRNLTDIEYVSMEIWDESHVFLKSVDETTCQAVFSLPTWLGIQADVEKNKHFGRYYLKNVFEALDTPGQWYLDRPTGTLYYLPLPGESMENTEVIAPCLDDLLHLIGEPEEKVHDIHLRGLTFSHNDWWFPPGERQGGQAAKQVPGAVLLRHATDCRIVDCTVSHISNFAIDMPTGCREILITGCTLTDLGGGGVKIGYHSAYTKAAEIMAGRARIDDDSHHCTVTDCEIGDGGIVHHGAVGIWVANSWGNTISHNHVHHLNYSGISVGWMWGYRPSRAACNTVEYNHVHHIGQGMLSDGGGIYTLGISPGTVIRNNLIHDVQAYSHAGRGIYNDEGSSFILMENNIVYRTSQSAYHLNYGRENIIRNNIFVCESEENVTRGGQEEHLSFVFEKNIVYIAADRMFSGAFRWDKGNFKMDHNLYWRVGGRPFDFPGDRSFSQWQEWFGQDRNTIIADPLFVNPENGDFRLKPGSPAEKIGFVPIDTGKIGRLRK